MDGGTNRGGARYSSTSGYLAFVSASGQITYVGGSAKYQSCYVGNLPKLTVSKNGSAVGEYVMDSGSWSITEAISGTNPIMVLARITTRAQEFAFDMDDVDDDYLSE